MRTIAEILKDIHDIACKQAMLHKIASSYMQINTLNGLKRKYRVISKKYYDLSFSVMTKAYDYYEVKISPLENIVEYSPTNVIYHFDKWKDLAQKDLDKIGELNKEFYELTGFDAPKTHEIKKMLLKQIEKSKRILHKYKSMGNESSFMVELYAYDRFLHEKYKQIEGKAHD